MLDVAAFAALLKRKRGEAKLTQDILALDVFGDSARKADISRLENGKVANPQEATIQKLCKALNISVAEMEPIRRANVTAAQLDQIPTLSREELQNIAARFQIEGAFERTDVDLRKLLIMKAEEHREAMAELASLKGLSARIDNIHGAATAAATAQNYVEANELIAQAREIHTSEILRPAIETNARLIETQARFALLDGDVNKTFLLLSTAADSFAAIDPLEPARRRTQAYFAILRNYGLRYGGTGLAQAENLLLPLLTSTLRKQDEFLWAKTQGNLANALQDQGIRTKGRKGVDLLAKSAVAFRAALDVLTRDTHPLLWATVQNNLGNTLSSQGMRIEGNIGVNLLAYAEEAYSAALGVRTRCAHAMDWASTQSNLSIALHQRGSRTKGAMGEDLLLRAVTACHAALEVYTRDTHPEDWAMTQLNLGIALTALSRRVVSYQSAELLEQALKACHAALEVRTREAHSVQWAETLQNLALVHFDIAHHESCSDCLSELRQALKAVDDALTVFDPIHMSYNHATVTALRTDILARLAP